MLPTTPHPEPIHTALENLRASLLQAGCYSAESWRALLACSRILSLKRKEFLLREGQYCRAVFFVSGGLLRSFQNRDGKDINTGFFAEGHFVTNLQSLRKEEPSAYAIQALEKATVVCLDAANLLDAYAQTPALETFARAVLEAISKEQEEAANSFRLFSPAQRLAALEAARPELFQRVSLSHLASYLGISRETLSRLRARRMIL